MNDEALLERVGEGDMNALGELYRRHVRILRVVATRFTDSESSEDIVQDTFAALRERVHLYRRERGKVIAWLTTIVRNRALDARRRTRRRAHLSEDAAPRSNRGENKAEVRLCLAQVCERANLSHEVTAALGLVHVTGYTCSEVAELQGVPVGTVKSRIARSLAGLRDAA